jgi:hypothetical protein
MPISTINTNSIADDAVTVPKVTDQVLTHRNLIINGAMVIDQINAGASITITNTIAYTYTVDRWATYTYPTGSKFSIQQNAGSVTPPVGFTKYLGATSLSAHSIGSSDIHVVRHAIEGFNVADLGWGSANAKSVTLSFWVRGSLTGTFGGSLTNALFNRSYPFSYTISVANTWEQKKITINGDTSGTWATDNTAGININFGLGVGSSYSGTAGSWASGDYRSSTGATSVVGTNGATFQITGVQLEVGSVATPFEHRSFGDELQRCQRYYWAAQKLNQVDGIIGGIGMAYGADSLYWPIIFPTTMRTTPSVASGGTWRTRQNNLITFTAAFGYQQSGISGVILAQGATGNAAASVFWVEPNDGTAFLNFDAEL